MVRSRTLRLTAVAAVVVVALVTGCQAQLTPDTAPYRVSTQGGRITVANLYSGTNEREALFSSTSPSEASSTECETWVSGQGVSQNGVAFRVAPRAGGWDAVVLERNIWYLAFWGFVVIYFHDEGDHATQFDVGPEISLGSYLGTTFGVDVFPLRICASIAGNRLAFAVAKGNDAMPALGTPGQGALFTLNPQLMPAAGRTGSYIAHVPRNGPAVIDSVMIDGHPAPTPTS